MMSFGDLPPELQQMVSRANAATAPIWSDDRLADALVERHGQNLRYVATWGRWLIWDGARWRRDETWAVYDLARQLCRAILTENPGIPKEGIKALTDSATFSSVERVARSDRRVARTVDAWDADPWLMATPGGTVDLRTGELRPASRDDHSTKLAAVAPTAEAACPTWLAFLDRMTGGDNALKEYLKRLSGYCLTGSIAEHTFAFFYGTGANGKGTFINAVVGLLGEYATVAPAEVFQDAKWDRHPAELAMLRGARLVAAQETEQGRRWAETRIKALTGGDPVTARHMRCDFFTFQPQFKLLVAGNHRPGLRTVDEAIRRRLHLVPCTLTVPPEERDKGLADKLRQEWPAILRWAIDGCREWQRVGLRPPAAVQAATSDYFEGADAFSQWLTESTEKSNSEWQRENTADLFLSWKTWAERAGEPVGSQRSFSEAMEKRGYTKKREPGTGKTGFLSIRLRRTDYAGDHRSGG